MIEVKNISKKFGNDFYADKDISFTAADGEIIGILGPNGAGKTTLLRIIAGIMKPVEGEVLIDGKNLKEQELVIKKDMAFLSGNTKLYKDISPKELLYMMADIYDIPQSKADKKIKEIIERLSMKSFCDKKIGELSTGQMQRTNIARCMVHDPKYYILDEATSGLDIISSQVIINFVKEEKERGKCILYSTHYMEEAENICDKVVLIHKGEVLNINTPEKIEKETKTDNLRDAFFAIIGSDYHED